MVVLGGGGAGVKRGEKKEGTDTGGTEGGGQWEEGLEEKLGGLERGKVGREARGERRGRNRRNVFEMWQD